MDFLNKLILTHIILNYHFRRIRNTIYAILLYTYPHLIDQKAFKFSANKAQKLYCMLQNIILYKKTFSSIVLIASI